MDALPLAADAAGLMRTFGIVSALTKSSSETVDRSTGTASWLELSVLVASYNDVTVVSAHWCV